MEKTLQNITIHIGYHKCGSTLLQKHVFSRMPAFYVGPDSTHLLFSQEMLDRVHSPSFDAKEYRNEILEKAAGADHIIISHEELSGSLSFEDPVDPEVTARNMKAAFPEAKILCIVRNQSDWLKSLYAFRCSAKGNETRDFDTFLNEEGEKGLFAKLEYPRLISYYQKLFGSSQCKVVPFEMLKDPSADFLATVANLIGYDAYTPMEAPVVNRSTKHKKAIDVCRIINRVFPCIQRGHKLIFKPNAREEMLFRYNYYGLRRKMANKLADILPKESIEFSYVTTQFLNHKYGPSNEQLGQLIGIDLKEYGYPTSA